MMHITCRFIHSWRL